jgi:hypothetical protein
MSQLRGTRISGALPHFKLRKPVIATPFDGLTNKKPLGFAKRAQLDSDRQLLSGPVGEVLVFQGKKRSFTGLF